MRDNHNEISKIISSFKIRIGFIHFSFLSITYNSESTRTIDEIRFVFSVLGMGSALRHDYKYCIILLLGSVQGLYTTENLCFGFSWLV